MAKPLLVNPPMCSLKELEDGTYTLYHLEKMHQLIEMGNHIKESRQPLTPPKFNY